MADAARPPAADAAAIAAAYRLRLRGRRFRGRIGGQRSRAAGGSLEFFDLRDYVPGDDVRHVDWHGFARTGQLRVRQFEAEVAPRVDIVVDTSPSMAVTAAKSAATLALVDALAQWAHHEGVKARICCLAGDAVARETLVVGDGPAVPALPRVPLRSGGVRVLVSDALWSQSPRALLHGLAAGAAHFLCLQLLDPWELAPRAGDVLTLVDCESGERIERTLDAATVAGYQQRLQRLVDEVRTTVVGSAGLHACVVAADLASMCAESLLPAGIVEPA